MMLVLPIVQLLINLIKMLLLTESETPVDYVLLITVTPVAKLPTTNQLFVQLVLLHIS